MAIALKRENTYTHNTLNPVAYNSLDLSAHNFITVTSGVAVKATAGSIIEGVNNTIAVFASDNETVAFKTVEVITAQTQREYLVSITGGTITAGDVGHFYDLSNSVTVDGASESTTTGQLKLVEFVSATSSIFEIVNL